MISCNKGEVDYGGDKRESLADLGHVMAAYLASGITLSEILSTLAAVLEEDLEGLEDE